MAHFAQLDVNNIVTQVIVVHNNELMDGTDENEAKGIAFCQSLFGKNTRWVQTSYNANFRGAYAGIGYAYDPVKDEFVPPPSEIPPEIEEAIAFNKQRVGDIPNDFSPETP